MPPRFISSVLWPAICVAGVWFFLTGSLLPLLIIAGSVFTVWAACQPRSKQWRR